MEKCVFGDQHHQSKGAVAESTCALLFARRIERVQVDQVRYFTCRNVTLTCVRRIAPCADAIRGRTEALLGRCCKAIEVLKRRLAEHEASALYRPPDHETNAMDAGVQGGVRPA